jgi:hypothetical protein
MFGMSRKVVTEVNAMEQPAEQSPLPVSPLERLELAEKEYRRVQGALGELRVSVFNGKIAGQTARRRKEDLEDELDRAGKSFQTAMAENANSVP